jgi:diguanylate cyclase (GGDEF)-like protein
MQAADIPARSRLAGGAFWVMLRRVAVIAGAIDALWIPMYAALGSPFLAALNFVSVALYGIAYVLIGNRRNTLAVSLIWLEVLVHSAIGSLLIGWESGFHYFLLMFIPAIVLSSVRKWSLPLIGALLAFYLGLYAACQAFGPLSPLQPWALSLAHVVNVLLIFGMFYTMASFYRTTVVKAERRLLAAATTDHLTGLANRSQFHIRALTELSHGRRRGDPTALLLGDVDYFKRINDEYGHEAGDKVLVRLAELMRTSLREVDVLARWGGEEFLALMPGSNTEAAALTAERLRQAVAAVHIDVGGRMVQVTMSFGVSEVHDTPDLQSATARADQALYNSKREGRNCVSCAPVLSI